MKERLRPHLINVYWELPLKYSWQRLLRQKQHNCSKCFSIHFNSRELQVEYERLKTQRTQDMTGSNGSLGSKGSKDAELMQEAKNLRQHKGRLEARMQILEDHNKQLEAQLQRLRQLLEQVRSGCILFLVNSFQNFLFWVTSNCHPEILARWWFTQTRIHSPPLLSI